MSCRRGANCTLSTMLCSFLAGRLQLGLRRVQTGIGMLWGNSLQRRPWWSSETLRFHAGGVGSIPGQGTKISH